MNYNFLLETKTAQCWIKTGTNKRSGVVVPLFSLRSKESVGIGEIPDLYHVVKWCKKTGMSIIQLLPLNDTGFDFAPYNCVSSFALDPMYISFSKLKYVNLNPFKKDIRELKCEYENLEKVNYKIKKDKIKILRRIYKRSYLKSIKKFDDFVNLNYYWLRDYALYKILKEINSGNTWEKWELKSRDRDALYLDEVEKNYREDLIFHYWLQWQLYEQMKAVKKYASERGVFIMGDLPYLVGRDSADVWSNRKIFKLHLSSGAPPDMYFSKGQRWGMPPYNREELQSGGYEYINNKLKYAENFYDMYRIDHFVGLFRVWTIDINEPEESAGFKGKFDPEPEYLWEESGKKLLDVFINGSSMLPCAEDLGTVPECSGRVLWEYGITGIDVQRWMKDHSRNFDFLEPDKYRWLSVATVSTHDSSPLPDWWHNEAGTIDESLFERLYKSKGLNDVDSIKKKLFEENSAYGRLLWKEEIDSIEKLLEILSLPWEKCWDIADLYRESYGERKKFLNYINYDSGKLNIDFISKSLEKILSASSIFCINLLQEWLCLDENFLRFCEEKSYRINFPGVVNESNWTAVYPYKLETILELPVNNLIREMNYAYGRVQTADQ